jgi:hypothetical protein
MLRARREDLRKNLRRLSQGELVIIDGFVFKRMANGIVATLPDSHLKLSAIPNVVWDIHLSPKEAIKKMWQLMRRRESYTRHDLFWEKMDRFI